MKRKLNHKRNEARKKAAQNAQIKAAAFDYKVGLGQMFRLSTGAKIPNR